MKKNLKRIIGWAALALLVVFVVINWASVDVNLLFVARVKAPLSLVILGAAVLGAGAARFVRRLPPRG
ncbi:MAG: DUF1049 domain-containing protein [Planctomycetes bacterium]|nr:DUF1049 domain-containing protein [Planctomycetota bacterium]